MSLFADGRAAQKQKEGEKVPTGFTQAWIPHTAVSEDGHTPLNRNVPAFDLLSLAGSYCEEGFSGADALKGFMVKGSRSGTSVNGPCVNCVSFTG